MPRMRCGFYTIQSNTGCEKCIALLRSDAEACTRNIYVDQDPVVVSFCELLVSTLHHIPFTHRTMLEELPEQVVEEILESKQVKITPSTELRRNYFPAIA